jgi:hypothetical protein
MHADKYGRFEAGNKMSYPDFQRYIDNNVEPKVNFMDQLLPKIR